MPHVSDVVNDVSPCECAEVDKALLAGETVHWATRPLAQLWCAESVLMCLSSLPGLVFACLWTHESLQFPDTMALLLQLVSLPLWGAVLYFAAFPWLRRRKLQRSLYVLTNRRALVLEPGLFSCKVTPYPLHQGMVLERHTHANGGGGLVFARERRHSAKGTRTIRHGFMSLAHLADAEQKLAELLAALPPKG